MTKHEPRMDWIPLDIDITYTGVESLSDLSFEKYMPIGPLFESKHLPYREVRLHYDMIVRLYYQLYR